MDAGTFGKTGKPVIVKRKFITENFSNKKYKNTPFSYVPPDYKLGPVIKLATNWKPPPTGRRVNFNAIRNYKFTVEKAKPYSGVTDKSIPGVVIVVTELNEVTGERGFTQEFMNYVQEMRTKYVRGGVNFQDAQLLLPDPDDANKYDVRAHLILQGKTEQQKLSDLTKMLHQTEQRNAPKGAIGQDDDEEEEDILNVRDIPGYDILDQPNKSEQLLLEYKDDKDLERYADHLIEDKGLYSKKRKRGRDLFEELKQNAPIPYKPPNEKDLIEYNQRYIQSLPPDVKDALYTRIRNTPASQRSAARLALLSSPDIELDVGYNIDPVARQLNFSPIQTRAQRSANGPVSSRLRPRSAQSPGIDPDGLSFIRDTPAKKKNSK